MTAIATPRLLCGERGRFVDDDLQREHRVVLVALQGRRAKPSTPAERQRVGVGIEPARRRLVASQNELNLEIELIVAEKARQRRGVRRAARRREETRRTGGG